jgi:hypothetical protein
MLRGGCRRGSGERPIPAGVYGAPEVVRERTRRGREDSDKSEPRPKGVTLRPRLRR